MSPTELEKLFEPQLETAQTFTEKSLEEMKQTRRDLGRSEEVIEQLFKSVIIGETKLLYFMVEYGKTEEEKLENPDMANDVCLEIQRCYSTNLEEVAEHLKFASFIEMAAGGNMPRFWKNVPRFSFVRSA